MSFWSRFANVFRGERFSREIDEELRSHIDEAIEDGCDEDPPDCRQGLQIQRYQSQLRHSQRSFRETILPRRESPREVVWRRSLFFFSDHWGDTQREL